MEIVLILSEDWIKASNEFSEYARQITKYGFYKGVNTKQQEQQGGDKQRGVSFKDSREVLKRNGYSTLLGIKERSYLLQDKAMRIPCKGTEITFQRY